MAGKRSTRLKSIGDCHRFLATTINAYARDEITGQKAGKLGYLINILVSIIRDAELEVRLRKLEEKFEENRECTKQASAIGKKSTNE